MGDRFSGGHFGPPFRFEVAELVAVVGAPFFCCPLWKLRKDLGYVGLGLCFDPRMWHFIANVRMYKYITCNACANSESPNAPSWGVDHGSIFLQSGRPTIQETSLLERPKICYP